MTPEQFEKQGQTQPEPEPLPLRCYHPQCDQEPCVHLGWGVCYVSCTQHPLIVARAEYEEHAVAAYRQLVALTRGE